MNRREALRLAALAAGVAAIPPAAVAASAQPEPGAGNSTPQSPWRQPAAASRLAMRSAMLGIAAAGRRLVAVGERGRVIVSDDAGRSWHQARSVPVSVTLTAVAFASERLGWATGHCGVVLHTADAGDTWALQYDGERAAADAARQLAAGDAPGLKRRAALLVADGPDKPFLDLDVGTGSGSGSEVIVVGAYGLVFSTKDGGSTWTPRLTDTDNPKGLHLNAVASFGGTTFICGERGLLLRADAGGSFVALPELYDGSFFAIGAAPDQGVTVAGLRGNAFHGGGDAGWQRLAAGDQTLTAVRAVAGRTLLASQDGVIRSLGARGETARVLDLPRAPAPVTDLALASDGGLVAATLRGPVRLADRLPA